MIASLPMYLTPLTAAGYDRFWHLIAANLRRDAINAPSELQAEIPDLIAHWQDPDLLLSQTCGLPYRAVLKDRVTLVATPDYGLPDCPPGYYNSVVIVREADKARSLDELAGRPFAYNDPLSQSGWAALALSAGHVLSGPSRCTGSHRASAAAVSTGDADFAAIDAQTWRQLQALGLGTGLRVVHATPPVPGLPLITMQPDLAVPLAVAVAEAIDALDKPDRDRLGLRGLVAVPAAAYDLPIPPPPGAFG